MYRLLLSIAITLFLVVGCSNGDVENENGNNGVGVEENGNNVEEGNNEGEEAGNTGEAEPSEFDGMSAEEILEKDPEADLFVLDGAVYMTGIEQTENVSLTVKELTGKVLVKASDTDAEFEDGMASVLPPNTKFYLTNEESDKYLLAEVQSDHIVYYAVSGK